MHTAQHIKSCYVAKTTQRDFLDRKMHRFILAVCFVALATGQPDTKGQQGQPDTKGQQGQPDTKGQQGQPDIKGQQVQPDNKGPEVPKGKDDPCENYKPITEQKRSAKYKASEDEPNLSDQNIDDTVWHRFQGLPPQRLHGACVLGKGCGTDEPVWMKDPHPTAADPGPKEAVVCAAEGNECCRGWNATIQVKFCRDPAGGDDFFFVYLLKKVRDSDMAYCSGDEEVCAKGTTWNPNSKTCTPPRPIIADPVFKGPTRVKKTLKGKDPYDDFYFSCNIQWSNPDTVKKGEQFEVTFTFDGQSVNSVPPKITNGSDLNVKLWSKEIKGHVGKEVGCQVRSYWKMLENTKTKKFRISQTTYFVGIRYSLTNKPGSFKSDHIEIDEKSPPLTLYFQSTVPISCPETTFETSCKVVLNMADISDEENLGVLKCFIIFNGMGSGKIPPEQMIKAQMTPGLKTRTSVLRFLPIECNPEFFWYHYQLPEIPIFIKDTSKSSMCQSWGDPHITTFDKRYYNVYLEGDYLFAKSTERNFEVHVRHHKYGSVATVNCAVAVREGNNVIGINFCAGPSTYPTPITYLRDNNVPGATITLSGRSYTITMPSGAYVRADYSRGEPNSRLDIYLYLNSADFGKTLGLCGVWNGNSNDDTVPKGTTTNDGQAYPNTFSKSYMLKPEESFINGHVTPIQCLDIKDLVPNICTCDEYRAVTCAAPDAKPTTMVSQFVENCNQATKNRRRRGARSTIEIPVVEIRKNDMVITEDDMPIPKIDEQHGANFKSSWPTASGITKEQAERYCQTKMESSPVYQMCKDRIVTEAKTVISGCVEDAQAVDNLTASSSFIATQFQRLCVHTLEISVVSNGSSTPTPEETLLSNVASMICPDQCNGNGNCQNGICVCNAGFVGDDCSVDLTKPPKLESFRKGVNCDFRTSFCQETLIYASNFFVSERFRCNITAVDHSKHFPFRGSPLSNGEVTCRLPEVYKFTDETSEVNGPAKDVGPAPFYRWDISITNDGSSYSNSLRLTVFDSKCQEIRSDGTITQKAETCLIAGRCYGSGEASRLNRCEKCLPSINRDKWTHDDTVEGC